MSDLRARELPDHVEASPSLACRTWTCPRCNDFAEVDVDPASEIMLCTDCGGDDGRVTRVAFGRLQPRVIITPASDRRFIEIRIGDKVYELDALYATMIGDDLASLRPMADRVAATLMAPPEGATVLT